MKTPITRDRLRHHFTYNWWLYLLLGVVAVFGWNLIFTTTAYRPPDSKKVEWYIVSPGFFQEEINAWMEDVRLNRMPDMEQMDCVALLNDDYYGDVQLSTYIAVGEGDLYLMPADRFQSFASAGVFAALEDREALVGAAEGLGIDLTRGWRTDVEEGTRHLFGIPASKLTGLNALGIITQDTYLAVLGNGGNLENTIPFLQIVLETFTETPEATPSDL